jgi:hypothetical protein
VVDAHLPDALAAATNAQPALSGPFGSRKQLALWLTQPDHPLTARVLVNRLWQWHFGQGLVSTANDFGHMGQAPTHPELLDWLACELVSPQVNTQFSVPSTQSSGPQPWRIKRMHKLIMLSEAYRRDSRFANDENLRADPENRLLWRMNRRRLEAEALWDAIHAAAGTLNLKLGGRPVMPPLAEDEIAALRDRWHWPVSADPADHNRRGMYIFVRRNFRFPMFEVFDAPVNSVSCPARDVTTVAPQALWFMNNATMFRQAQELAARLVRESANDSQTWIERAFAICLSRRPTESEQQEAVRLIDALSTATPAAAQLDQPPAALAKIPPQWAAALTKFCLALFNLNEFVFID